MSTYRTPLVFLIFCSLTGCIMVQPFSIERSQQRSWQGENLNIDAAFDELLMHQLTLSINGEQVIKTSLGNPQFPDYSESAGEQQIQFKPAYGSWHGQKLTARCHQGVWAELRKYPVCSLYLEQQLLTEFNFNRP